MFLWVLREVRQWILLKSTSRSELIDEVVEAWDALAESLSGSDAGDELGGLAASLERIAVHLVPMAEHALREGTAGSGGTESLGESERLSDGEEGLHVDERSACNRLLSVDDTSPLGQALVDATDGVIRALDLHKEDRLHEAGRGSQLRGVEDTSSSTVTASYGGAFQNEETKKEFLQYVYGTK